MFKMTWSMIMGLGAVTAVHNCQYRLRGLVNNGVEYERKEKELKKYDLTTKQNEKSWWGFFRLYK